MLRWVFFLFTCLIFCLASCKKDGFITSKEAFLLTSDTAIHFDTVFTSVGSITKQLKLFNINDQKLRISSLTLAGGASSFFKINVSGTPGTQFNNIDLDGGDSLYIFITVNIDPSSGALPFLIDDSLRIDYNGNTQIVKLDAYGQNAHFLRSTIISQNTTWTNDLPYILLDTFAVDKGVTLSIEGGTKVYCGANTPFTVAGTLHVNGTNDSTGSVSFVNNRLDAPYNEQPGTWQGIYFAPQSRNNILTFTHISNALQGIAADEGSEISLAQCIISNCAEGGIVTYHSTVKAVNCLVSNNSYNVYCLAGGTYSFTNCTLASYNTKYLFHQYPALTLSNANDDETEVNALQAQFENCIIWGEDGTLTDEVINAPKAGASSTVTFTNTLYRGSAEATGITYADCLQNTDPLFQTADTENDVFDFHLSSTSPCIDAGKKGSTAIDLEGNLRSETPDIGCYEFH